MTLFEHSQCFLYDRSHVIILVFGKAAAKDNIFFLVCQVLVLRIQFRILLVVYRIVLALCHPSIRWNIPWR